LLDISTFVFVLSIMVVGLLLTATIRRDFARRRRPPNDLQRHVNHARARRRQTERQ
jgi:hypothetical protein